jgi:hypothetical protein
LSKGPEAEFQDAVVRYARLKGWRVAHFRRATVREGRHATPVAYDGGGFPDLTMVRGGIIVFAELKRAGVRKLQPEQAIWREELIKAELVSAGVFYYVWNPHDIKEIERILR